MRLKPKFGRVLLERERMTSSSLIIPENVEKMHAPARGKVVAVGPECDESISEGMDVLFGQYAGAWIMVDNQEFFICQDEDVLMAIEQE